MAIRARLGGPRPSRARQDLISRMPSGGANVSQRARIEVVAAVIFNESGEFLLAQRPEGKAYAGYWEFPGGKVEPGEAAAAALNRELHEELGIEVTRAYPWLTRDFDYPHADVRLRFFRVHAWTGELHGRESQEFAWQSIHNISVAPILPANGPILRGLELPGVYGITCAGRIGREAFMDRLRDSLQKGLRLIQVREKEMPGAELIEFAREVISLARVHGARVMVNGSLEIATQAGADGLHLTAARLMAATARPACDWCAASCHDAAELERARELAMDFVVLGPIAATPSHVDSKLLGWENFSRLIRNYPLPVYALGGLRAAELEQAWLRGAHGVGLLRDAWSAARF
ncbi:MAG: thiamine monophosphate synthase [Betaproteobacteria bacterium]|nr:thiamine monophosphate synthase [Betaproteobacteria bacterium]